MAIEDIYDDIGGMGAFQVIIVVWLYGLKAMVGWSMMQMAFAGYGPDYTCLSGDEGSDVSGGSYAVNSSQTSAASLLLGLGASASSNVTQNVCSVNGTSCAGYAYEGVKRTAVTEFDLVCDYKWIRSTITSVQMGGVMLGAFIAGQAGDYFGRKRTNYGFYLLMAVLNVVAMFSTSWEMFMALRVLIGITIGAMLVIVIPYPAEFFPRRWRYLVTVVPTWPIGVLLFALFAWLLEDWAHLHLTCAVLQIPGLLGYFYIPESVRWLTVQGRVDEAYAVIKKMARANRKPVPDYAREMLERIADLEQESQGKSKNYSYLDIFKGRQMIRLTFIFAFHWFALSLVFYGLSFAVSGLSGDLYLNMLLMTSVEVPAYLFNLCLTQRLGRRWTCFAFFAVAAIASAGCIIVHLTEEEQSSDKKDVLDEVDQFDSSAVGKALITALCMVAKLCAAACWAANQTWVAESYPTVTRSLGYASANVAARVGGVLAPFVINPGDLPLLTYSMMAILMFAALLLTPLVPETKDLVLSESVGNQEVVIDPNDANAIQQKTLNSDSSSQSEASDKDSAFHIGYSNGKKRQKGVADSPVRLHLLSGQNGAVTTGDASGATEAGSKTHGPNNIEV